MKTASFKVVLQSHKFTTLDSVHSWLRVSSNFRPLLTGSRRPCVLLSRNKRTSGEISALSKWLQTFMFCQAFASSENIGNRMVYGDDQNAIRLQHTNCLVLVSLELNTECFSYMLRAYCRKTLPCSISLMKGVGYNSSYSKEKGWISTVRRSIHRWRPKGVITAAWPVRCWLRSVQKRSEMLFSFSPKTDLYLQQSWKDR